jgi:hypothetical protein
MSKLELVLLVVALANVAVVVEFVRRRDLQEGFALLWLGIGASGLAFAVGRGLFDRLARFLGVSYGANLILAMGILALVFICMGLSLHVSRLETRVELLAEELGLLRARSSDGTAVVAPLGEPVVAPGDAVDDAQR